MYQDHFGLKAMPFENTPDPAFFYMGAQYRETLAVLIHSVAARKGLMLLVAPIGTGKTTLARTFVRYLPEETKIINMVHPKAAEGELLRYVADQLGVDNLGQPHLFLVDAVRARLANIRLCGQRCALVIDEAQLLSDQSLEEIRLLTNMETSKSKLLQIIMVGQPELGVRLDRPEYDQLRQRVAIYKTLGPLNRSQAMGYILSRIKAAGGSMYIFSDQALEAIIQASGGIPRRINQLCDAALTSAFATGQRQAELEDVREAMADTLGLETGKGPPEQGGNPFRRPGRQPRVDMDRAGQQPQARPRPVISRPQVQAQPAPEQTPPKPSVFRGRGWLWPTVLVIIALAVLMFSASLFVEKSTVTNAGSQPRVQQHTGQTYGASRSGG